MVKFRLMVTGSNKEGGSGLKGRFGVKVVWRIKNFFPYRNELLICAYPKNLVKMGLIVEAMETFYGRGQQGTAGDGRAWDVIV